MRTQDILAELPSLSIEDQEQIAKALRALEAGRQTTDHPAAREPREAGLHAGAWIIAEDFDDPVAELHLAGVRPLATDPLQVHPELAATILYDPTEPASEEEWPAEVR